VSEILDRFVRRWDLIPDGEPLLTKSSHLLPVLYGGQRAMLKVALTPEEQRGNRWMVWAATTATAPVLAQAGDALLMLRAEGSRDLAHMARSGRDDEATRILCDILARLHDRGTILQKQTTHPLSRWLRPLNAISPRHGPVVAAAAVAAADLLAQERTTFSLHGDIHHGNVLDFGRDGWRAIDPKALSGDRTYDYANIFCNPDTATATARFDDRIAMVATVANIDTERLLQWILAWSGLSAYWQIESEQDARGPLAIGALAIARLDRQ